MKRLTILVALLSACIVAATFTLTLAPGDVAIVNGCTTNLQLAGTSVVCVTRSATPTIAPTATNTPTATATPTSAPPTATATNTPTSQPAAITGLAIIGDSTLDEYRANDNRGGVYGVTTFNWLELLVRKRGLNVGMWGTRSEPRRSGYEFNWARSGDTSIGAEANQLPGVIGQLQSGAASHVIVFIGLNDFAPWGSAPSPDIYSGALSGATLTSRLNTISNRISAIARNSNTTAPGRVLLIGVQDYLYLQLMPDYEMGLYSDPVKRQRIIDAVAYVNGRLQSQATMDGVHYLDYNAAMLAELNTRRSGLDIIIGGQVIDVNLRGDEPHHVLLGDTYVHPGTAYNGLVVNVVIARMNQLWGLSLAPMTDSEILAAAGIN